MGFYFTLIKMAVNEKVRQLHTLARMWRDCSPHTFLVRKYNDTVIVENRLAVPQIVKHRVTI